ANVNASGVPAPLGSSATRQCEPSGSSHSRNFIACEADKTDVSVMLLQLLGGTGVEPFDVHVDGYKAPKGRAPVVHHAFIGLRDAVQEFLVSPAPRFRVLFQHDLYVPGTIWRLVCVAWAASRRYRALAESPVFGGRIAVNITATFRLLTAKIMCCGVIAHESSRLLREVARLSALELSALRELRTTPLHALSFRVNVHSPKRTS